MSVIAIDLGGTKALGAVFTPGGKLLAKKHRYLDGASGESAGRIVLELSDNSQRKDWTVKWMPWAFVCRE